MPTAAVIYCRISKDELGDHLGVDRQERVCRDLAQRHGLHVTDVLVDNDVSAYHRRKRPQFERLVDMLATGTTGAVIAYHADRLYRRTTDLERLVDVVETSRAQVHTVAAGDVDLTTASGRMVARMLGATAQHESERMGERLKMKGDELAAKGRPPGGRPPFGYVKGYTIEPTEAQTVRHIVGRVLAGASLLSIARELDAAGMATREGRPWHHSTVRAVIVNPAIAGLRILRREIVGLGDWEPILDRATWEQVRATVADPARKRSRPARRYVLGGLVQSTKGDVMNGRPEVSGAAYATRWHAERPTSIDAERLEAHVIENVLVALRDWRPTVAPTNGTAAATEIVTLEADLAELARLRGERQISMAEWLAAREPLERDLAIARRGVTPVRSPVRLLAAPDIRAAWEKASIEEKRQAIAAVVDVIIVDKATRGRWTTMDERVTIRWR